MWVSGSRQFKDFEDYLVPRAKFESLKAASKLPLKIETDCEKYLEARLRTVAESYDHRDNARHRTKVARCRTPSIARCCDSPISLPFFGIHLHVFTLWLRLARTSLKKELGFRDGDVGSLRDLPFRLLHVSSFSTLSQSPFASYFSFITSELFGKISRILGNFRTGVLAHQLNFISKLITHGFCHFREKLPKFYCLRTIGYS